MKKINRVRKTQEFEKIIKLKNSWANKTFVVYATSKKYDECRIGISVSKKLGNAVVRNKIKRQIRMMINELSYFKGGDKDLIVIVRATYILQNYHKNKKDLEIAFKKVKIKK